MTSFSVLTIHVHPFLFMSHIARGGALRDVQRVTEAMPFVASVCQGMQGVERKWRGGKRNRFFFICCSRSNFCAKKLAVQGSFFVHNIWRSFTIRIVGADLKESGLRVRNNAKVAAKLPCKRGPRKHEKMDAAKFDDVFMGMLQHCEQVEPFLDAMFSFLARRTDFFRVMHSRDDKMGFPPGVAEKIVLKVRYTSCVFG